MRNTVKTKTVFNNPFLQSVTHKIVVPPTEFFKRSTKHTLAIHAGFRSPNSPSQEHLLTLPGSFFLDTSNFEVPPLWHIKSDQQLMGLFIDKHRVQGYEHILIYGSKGNTAACRLGLVLMYMGFNNFSILDGGILHIEESLNNNQPSQLMLCDSSTPSIEKQNSFRGPTLHKEILMDAKTAFNIRGNAPQRYQLVDVRSLAEHKGLTSGYSYFQGKGRPVGSVYGGSIQNYVQPGTLTKGDFQEIVAKHWQPGKVDYLNKDLLLFCGTGWRAAEAFMYAVDHGFNNVGVFSGIIDWIDAGLPVES